MVSTAELESRPSRPPNYETDSRALVELSREIARSPDTILQKLAETALIVCRAHSAGLSLLEDGDGRARFHWRAIAGQWSSHMNGGTPRDFGPCGTVLDQKIPMVCSHPERDFPYWAPVRPVLEEALLIPFYIKGEAVGTIWVVAHDATRRFDAEDLRVMNSLGTFAAGAYQTILSLNEMQYVAAMVDSSDDAIISKDLDGLIRSWNRGAVKIFGYEAQEVIGKPTTILLPEDRLSEETEIIERIKRGQRIEHFETVRKRKHGGLVHISLSVSPVENAQGKIIGASEIARDITQRKLSEERIVNLARESEHRAKNVLATVQAAVHLSQSDTPDGLKHAIEGRIRALANVHSLFVQTRWAGAELRKMITQELDGYCHDTDARASLHGPEVFLDTDVAQAIAVAVHELATNAAKYGALSVPSGRVRVEWSRSTGDRVVLRWTETGGPVVKPPTRQGFGTRVMDSMTSQLKGEIRFDWREEGLLCEVGMPIGPQHRRES